MKIEQREKSSVDWEELRGELAELTRPVETCGPVCVADCPSYTPQRCNRSCPDAASMLSSEPDYPLEPKITPVVFEMKKLGAFDPCWSCEGHNHKDGSLWKLPQVWFYADSMVHVRVLAEGLAELHMREKLKVKWGVAITPLGPDNADTSFSMQPDLGGTPATLEDLQSDLDVIASNLRFTICTNAGSLSDAANSHGRNKTENNAGSSGDTGTLFARLRAAGS